MKAIRCPSDDHTGAVSWSTPGARYVMLGLLASYTPMYEWSPRSLTYATRSLVGDQTGLRLSPYAVKNGVEASDADSRP